MNIWSTCLNVCHRMQRGILSSSRLDVLFQQKKQPTSADLCQWQSDRKSNVDFIL